MGAFSVPVAVCGHRTGSSHALHPVHEHKGSPIWSSSVNTEPNTN